MKGTTVVDCSPDGFVVNSPGSKALPLRHSLAEHQKMWMQSINEAIEGKLTPSPEDEAAMNMGAPRPPRASAPRPPPTRPACPPAPPTHPPPSLPPGPQR